MRRKIKLPTPNKKDKKMWYHGDRILYSVGNGIEEGEIILITYASDEQTEEDLDYLVGTEDGYVDEIKRENIIKKC